MQRKCIDIKIARAIRFELGRAAKLGKSLVGVLQSGKREAERVMQSCIPWRRGDRGAQHALPIIVLPDLAIKIGEVDRRGRILRAQPKRGLVLDLGIGRKSASREEISPGGARLGPIGIEVLRGDELGHGAIKLLAIGGRLACAPNCGKQRGRPDAHATIGIRQQRRNQRPSWAAGRFSACRGRRCAPSDWDQITLVRQIDVRRRKARRKLAQPADASDRRRIGVRRHSRKQRRCVRLVRPGGMERLRVFLEALSA
jgi:hypothetical protein